jgi:hypothetical protein
MDSKYSKLVEKKQWKKLAKLAESKDIDDVIVLLRPAARQG